MARDLNKVQLTGRLGADPELRYTPQGNAITTFRVASNRSWRSPEGETHEETEWFRVVAWNKLAEVCHKWLAKGSRVYVEGRLQTRQWQDQEGAMHVVSEVIAGDMIILSRRDQPASHDEPAPALDQPIEPPSAALPQAGDTVAVGSAGRRAGRPARVARLSSGRAAFEEEDLPF